MPKSPVLTKTIVFSCFLASCLEIYDFAIFGFLAVVIHKNYLIFLDEELALIVTYAFFAVGFVIRPIGSLIFGYIGDVHGRKTALVTSVSLMGLASFLMFILPPYSVIGIWSCYLIVLVRLIQGISVGGEFTGAIVFAVEHSKNNNAGLVAGIVSAGGACGVLLATLISRILQHPSLPEYSWRFAFLLGFALALMGYFIRKKLADSPLFEKQNNNKIPLFEGLKLFKTESFATMCVAAANGVVFYFGTVYLGKFLQQVKTELDLNFVSILVAIIVAITLPFWGVVSDKVNRKIFLICTTLLMGMYSIVALNLMVSADSMFKIGALVFVYSMLASMMIGSVNIFAVEIFPVAQRMSCGSLFYSLGMGFVGGTVPMVASYIVLVFGTDPTYLSVYITLVCFLAAISVVGVYLKQKRIKLNDYS